MPHKYHSFFFRQFITLVSLKVPSGSTVQYSMPVPRTLFRPPCPSCCPPASGCGCSPATGRRTRSAWPGPPGWSGPESRCCCCRSAPSTRAGEGGGEGEASDVLGTTHTYSVCQEKGGDVCILSLKKNLRLLREICDFLCVLRFFSVRFATFRHPPPSVKLEVHPVRAREGPLGGGEGARGPTADGSSGGVREHGGPVLGVRQGGRTSQEDAQMGKDRHLLQGGWV